MSEIKKVENAKVEITSVVDGEKWAEAYNKAFNKLAAKTSIDGFRKGKAPKNILKKVINPQSVCYEAVDEIAQSVLEEAIKEHNVELIDRPELNLGTVNETSCTFIFTCPVPPDVELGDYKNLGYHVEEVSVTDGDVEAELDKLKEQKAELEIKEEGELENGDISVIDYEGFKDGVPFEGGKGEDYDLKLGSNTFIPGFEDQLIGKNAGEDVTVNVTFPDNYPSDDLKGKPAEFKCTVKSVSTTIVPEMDDELAKDVSEFETLDELKADIEKNIAESKQTAADRDLETKLLDKVLETLEGEIPEAMYESQVNNLMQDFAYRLQAQNMTLQSYMDAMGMDNEIFRGMFREQAERQVKVRLVLKKIAAEESLEPTAEEIEAEYAKLSESYGVKAEEARQFIPEETIKTDLAVDKALTLIKDSAVITPKAE